MSILKRLRDIVSSNINAMLDRAEDPEKMLEQYIRDMEESYQEAKVAVTQSIASKNRIEAKYKKQVEEVAKWEKNAILAVQKGEDDLAREALKRQSDAEQLRDTYKVQLDEQTAEVENLKSVLAKLESKLDEAKNKKDLLITQAKNAKAQKKIYDTMSKVGNEHATRGFDKMADKVEQMVAEAKASAEINTDSLEERFAALQENGGEIDDRLAALKAKLNTDKEEQ